MNKTYLHTASCLLSLCLLAACNGESTPGELPADAPVPVCLTAGVGDISTGQTAATPPPATRIANGRWETGDAIGLCMTSSASGEIANGVFNYRYLISSTSGATGSLTPDGQAHTAYFPADGTLVDFLAYSPYAAASVSPDFTLPVSVGTQPATDLLTARADGYHRDRASVPLSFRHRLTRLLFTVKGSGILTESQLAGATLHIGGMNTTATCHLADGSITAAAAPQDIAVPLDAAGTAGEAIVLPRPEAGAGVSFTVTLTNGNRYVARMSATQILNPGTQNTFRLTLRDQEAVVEATVEPWQDGTDAELEADGKKVAVETAAANSGFETGDTFTLWPGSVEGAGYLFTLGADKAWQSTPVLYWSSLPAEGETIAFSALHTPPSAPAGNQMPDLLAATAVAEHYHPVSLAFVHLAAQLNVVLKAGTGLTQGEVETAAVVVSQALTGYTLDGISLKAGTVRKDISLTGSGNKRHALLLPQTVEAGSRLLIFTIAGQEYVLPATAANGTFEGGKSYTLTVTVNRSGVDFSVSINPWIVGGESEGDAGMEID